MRNAKRVGWNLKRPPRLDSKSKVLSSGETRESQSLEEN